MSIGKKKINWESEKINCQKYVINLENDGSYDVIVPGGGGKDSSYVAWMLKNNANKIMCMCSTALRHRNWKKFR